MSPDLSRIPEHLRELAQRAIAEARKGCAVQIRADTGEWVSAHFTERYVNDRHIKLGAVEVVTASTRWTED